MGYRPAAAYPDKCRLIKMHRVFVIALRVPWLVKLMIIAVLVGRFLR